MRKRARSCVIASILALFVLLGTAAATFSDSLKAPISLTAARVEMLLIENEDNELPPGLNVIAINEGTLDSDLWLEKIYFQQNNNAVPEINGQFQYIGCSVSVTIEVTYKSETTTFFLGNPDQFNGPLLLLEGMEPSTEAFITIITISQYTASLLSIQADTQPDMHPPDIQSDITQEFLAEDSPPGGYFERLSISIPYILEFILKNGSFTSLPGEFVLKLDGLCEVYIQPAELLKPAFGPEATLETQAVDETVPPQPTAGTTPPEDSTEPNDETAPPEPTAGAAAQPENSIGPSYETNPPEPTTGMISQPEHSEEPADKTAPPEPTAGAAPQPENSNEPTDETEPDPTLEVGLIQPE